MTRTLVIGSNRGIGLELSRLLAARGDTVEAACRRASGALRAIEGVRIHEGVDVTDRDSVERLATTLGDASLDVLVVVAGILERVDLDHLDPTVIRRQLEVNAIGPLVTTAALRGCLVDGAKVAGRPAGLW